MQTPKRSLFEVLCNVGTGILTAYMTWKFIVIPQVKMLGWDLMTMNFWMIVYINSWFTLISIARGYLWRRWFNRGD